MAFGYTLWNSDWRQLRRWRIDEARFPEERSNSASSRCGNTIFRKFFSV